jgi:hypothetical protein
VLFLSTALLMGTAVAPLLAWTRKLRADIVFRERLRQVLLFLVVAQILLLGLWLLSVDTNQALLADSVVSTAGRGWGGVVLADRHRPRDSAAGMPAANLSPTPCRSHLWRSGCARWRLMYAVSVFLPVIGE